MADGLKLTILSNDAQNIQGFVFFLVEKIVLYGEVGPNLTTQNNVQNIQGLVFSLLKRYGADIGRRAEINYSVMML